ncbi:MAG TPA: helix-turn-helix transcriptional regulator [Rhizomicrobium sp.]
MRVAKSRRGIPADLEAKEVDTHVGGQVRRRRMLAGLTQQDVGKVLGLSFQQVQKYENGANRISAGRLFILARILATDVTEFYAGLNDEPRETASLSTTELKRAEQFMRSREGLRLNLSYVAIKNPNMRKRMLDLIAATNELSPR